MGNSLGCSAKVLLDCNPCLAKYSIFGGLNSTLHFAAAKGHNEIVGLLLENGADVNSRNYCGKLLGETGAISSERFSLRVVMTTILPCVTFGQIAEIVDE